MGYKHEVKALVKRLKENGWTVEQSKRRGHFKAFPPKGKKGFVLISGSPSCCHWLKNCLGDIKRIERENGITNGICERTSQ